MAKGYTLREYTRAFSLFNVEAGLVSNCREIIFNNEYFLSEGKHLHSLLSNFNRLKEIPFTEKHDFYLFLISGDNIPFSFESSDHNAYVSGNICNYEKESDDKRLSIFGNMGLFSKFYIRALEEKGIFSLHSTSFYNPGENRLYIVIGGTGSGKSTVALAAIEKKFKLFGAELTHFSIKNGSIIFHKGPLTMNCRVGNIVEDFPDIIDRFNIGNLPQSNIWYSYMPVYFGSVQTKEDRFIDPELTILYPRIEEERVTTVVEEVGINRIKKNIFDSMREKIAPPTFLYNNYLIPSIDAGWREIRRMKAAESLCSLAKGWKVYRILSSPKNCLEKFA